MPVVNYTYANGTYSDIDAIGRFERFLDDSHNEIAQNLHKQLVEFHSEIDDEVTKKLEELQSEIDELKTRNDELEARIEELEGEE